MRLPKFDYLAPASVPEALSILETYGSAAMVIAGGTDLVPRLRQRLIQPQVIISLKKLTALQAISVEGVVLNIGAMSTLKQVMDHPQVQTFFPGLVQALSKIGAGGIQHFRGTIGGNLLLNTRCWHYNQSAWWRSGRERCYKAGGQKCHAVPEGQNCLSACLSDGAVALMALSAQLVISSRSGERRLGVGELFTGTGETPFTLRPDELLTHIQLLLPPPGTSLSFQKLRWRSAIDFPLVSAAAVIALTKGVIDRARLVIGGAGPAPLVVPEAEQLLRNQRPSPELIDRVTMAAEQKAAGLIVENALASAEYRRKMVRVMAGRALLSTPVMEVK